LVTSSVNTNNPNDAFEEVNVTCPGTNPLPVTGGCYASANVAPPILFGSFPIRNTGGDMGWVCRFEPVIGESYYAFAMCSAGSVSPSGAFPTTGLKRSVTSPNLDQINANYKFISHLSSHGASKNVTMSGQANQPLKARCPHGQVIKKGSCVVEAKSNFVYSYPESISSWVCYSDQPMTVSIQCVNSNKFLMNKNA